MTSSTAPGLPPEHRTSLANRYGAPKRRLGKPLSITLIAVGLLLVVVVVFFLTRNQQRTYSTDNVSFDVVNSRQTDVTVAVKLRPKDEVTCGVQVLSEDHSVVGYKEESFSGSKGRDAGGGQRVIQRTIPIRTVFEGVTGQVSLCWKD